MTTEAEENETQTKICEINTSRILFRYQEKKTYTMKYSI